MRNPPAPELWRDKYETKAKVEVGKRHILRSNTAEGGKAEIAAKERREHKRANRKVVNGKRKVNR